MENCWKSRGGSASHSSTISMASTSSQENQNEMEMNRYYYHPDTAPDLRSTTLERKQGYAPASILNSSHRSVHVDTGYLGALLSGQLMLHNDFQEFFNPNSVMTSFKLPNDSSMAIKNTNSCGTSVTYCSLPSEYPSNQNMPKASNLCPVISSRTLTSSNSSSNFVGHSLPNYDLDKAVIHHVIPSNDNLASSLRKELNSNSKICQNVGKLCDKTIPTPSKMSSEAISDFHQSSAFMTGCPRVTCSGTGGHLLLSNTGLLGIVCACHCFHMSVFKFCEHSGLCNLNPGEAVHMDSGGTIAQWRKHYFLQFGIRIPEEQKEWDWPEGLSVTAGWGKSSVITPNMSKNSNLAHLVGSSGGVVRSGQSLFDVAVPKNFHSPQNMVDDALQYQQQRSLVDSDNSPLKDLTGSSQFNCHRTVDNQMMGSAIARCSTISKYDGLGPDNGCQSAYACIDSTMKNGILSISYPTLQKFRNNNKDSDVSRSKKTSNGGVICRDATSSNIELRLGQPHQPIHTSGKKVASIKGPQLLDTIINPPNSLFIEQSVLTSNLIKEEKLKPYLDCAVASNSCTTQIGQLNLGSPEVGISNSRNAGERIKFFDNVANSKMISPLHNFHASPQESKDNKAANNMANRSEYVLPKMLHFESNAAKYDQVNVYSNRGNYIGRQLNIPELDINRMGLSDSVSVSRDSGLRTYEQMKTSSLSTGVSGGIRDLEYTAIQDKRCYSQCMSSFQLDASDTRNSLNYNDSVTFPWSSGQVNKLFHHKYMDSSLGFGQNLLPQMGYPLATSTFLSNQTHLTRQEGLGGSSCSPDENFRILSVGHVYDSSRQQHAFSLHGMEKEPGRLHSFSNLQEARIGPSRLGEQLHGNRLSRKDDVFGLESLRQGTACRIDNGIKILPSMTGLSDFCSLPNLTPEIQVSLQNESSPLRCSRIGNYFIRPSEHENCFPGVPFPYFQGSRNFGACGTSPSQKQTENIACKASTMIASNFTKDYNMKEHNKISCNYSGKWELQLKNVDHHASQWRDVPKKVKGVSETTCIDLSANVLDKRGHDECPHGVIPLECFMSDMKKMNSLEKQEVSKISSVCCAPVTQTLGEVDNMDSCSVGAAGGVNNLLVDEESIIDKCSSSEDSHESERSAGLVGSTSEDSLRKVVYESLNNQSSCSLLDVHNKLIDSLSWKKGKKHSHDKLMVHGETDFHSQRFYGGLKWGNRKKAMKLKMLRASCPSGARSLAYHKNDKSTMSPSSSSKDLEMLYLAAEKPSCTSRVNFDEPTPGHRLSALTSVETFSHKRDLNKLYYVNEVEDNCTTKLNGASGLRITKTVSDEKLFERSCNSDAFRQDGPQDLSPEDGIRTEKYKPVGCTQVSPCRKVSACSSKVRPVVCGKYGEISSDPNRGIPKPAKIVSLSNILRSTKRCKLTKNFRHENPDLKECNHMNLVTHVEELVKPLPVRDKQFGGDLSTLEGQRDGASKKDCGLYITTNALLKQKPKDARKRSVYELIAKERNSSCEQISLMKTSKHTPEIEVLKVGNVFRTSDDSMHGLCKDQAMKYITKQKFLYILDSDALCCVCGSSNNDESNCLLECGQCPVRVHQACYGVSKLPKGRWLCRPCETNAKDTVCILCGYGGGAMTRALRSKEMVKGLIEALNIETKCTSKNISSSAGSLQNQINSLDFSRDGVNVDSFPITKQINIGASADSVCETAMTNNLHAVRSLLCVNNLKVHNSITAGVLDLTIKQWVHMVCGLWTPGTRCPNVNTMSAFDVSGAACPKAKVICSICNRAGGSCIKCRVASCSVQFHPWCAHQMGLLQSEVEGDDNEFVGFYGRCALHVTQLTKESGEDTANDVPDCPEKELTCARTEGYKGCKQDGLQHRLKGHSKRRGGGLVPQEQLNAWLHINGQKSCIQGLSRLPISNVEHDCRKEYARYKYAKAWKHLVVYKSGIHALGLYTSRLISRGEMVVEYIGEIVGLRVADRRENEYQSGIRLQYKSACYFFRIDKEHIIDATCKGGIARFVNHSCLPNCVAKVISVRNEKKVVFFAEREIFPGEEITYDYHFNREDEGKKIPCFCNSRNCRRYLN